MITKEARTSSHARALLSIAKAYKGTITGYTGGGFAGKHIGRKLFDRRIRKLSLPKKTLRNLRLKFSKNYRTDQKLSRESAGDVGRSIGQSVGGWAGYASDVSRAARKAKDWRRAGGRGQYRAPAGGGASLNKSLKNLGIPKRKVKTKAEAKRYYRKRAMETHPDRNPGKSTKDFREAKESWDNIQASSWYEKLAYVLRKQAAKKSKRKLIDIKRLKELLSKSGKSSIGKLNLAKIFGRHGAKSFGLGLAAFGGGAAISRVASKASQKMATDAEGL